MKFYVGCSGFHYKDWRGKFYPQELAPAKWLQYYTSKFNSLEINNSFYRLPRVEMMQKWVEQTPEAFNITLKGSRFVSHLKKLKMDDQMFDGLANFYSVASALGNKIGCIIWQFPENLPKDLSRLRAFCAALDPSYKNVLEFRDPDWYNDEVADMLQRHKIAFCAVSAPGELPETIFETAPFAYLRFHGKEEWYRYNYTAAELQTWKERIMSLSSNVEEVYAYFNNDMMAYAPFNAMEFAGMLNN